MQVLNLIMGALATHAWYVATFEDYPKRRRALIPCLL
jgi:3-oxo-5-alpha-steroid 4-dehydrogenase